MIELEHDERRCDQPGCPRPSTASFRVRQEFSRCGEKLASKEWKPVRVRWFCEEHAERGDCGLDDCDRNHERVATPGRRAKPKRKSKRHQ